MEPRLYYFDGTGTNVHEYQWVASDDDMEELDSETTSSGPGDIIDILNTSSHREALEQAHRQFVEQYMADINGANRVEEKVDVNKFITSEDENI